MQGRLAALCLRGACAGVWKSGDFLPKPASGLQLNRFSKNKLYFFVAVLIFA